MFGHIQANFEDLREEEISRYKAVYCGLCHRLGERHGFHTKFCLTYDLAFLIMLLSSLYEPEEDDKKGRCIAKPVKEHNYTNNLFTDYAADMTIALVYYKCRDDWEDEHKLTRRGYAHALLANYKAVKEKWPNQCNDIEKYLTELNGIENDDEPNPDEAADCFGKLMGSIFVWRDDHWKSYLWQIGFHLGQYIYLADAAIDFKEDQKNGNYNPLEKLVSAPESLRPILTVILGGASEAFEYLPLVQDANILRNILYSGIWIKYNRWMKEEGEEKTDGNGPT